MVSPIFFFLLFFSLKIDTGEKEKRFNGMEDGQCFYLNKSEHRRQRENVQVGQHWSNIRKSNGGMFTIVLLTNHVADIYIHVYMCVYIGIYTHIHTTWHI